MINNRTLELIHAEIDHELEGKDSDELKQIIATDSEARQLREQMQRMAIALGRMETVLPPAGRFARKRPSTQLFTRLFRPRTQNQRLVRQRLALAAGTLLAAIGLVAHFHDQAGLDINAVMGTLGDQPSVDHSVNETGASITKHLDMNDLQGQVTLRPALNNWALDFDFNSSQPVSVSLHYDQAAFGLSEQPTTDSGVSGFKLTPGRLDFITMGSRNLVVTVVPELGGVARLRFASAGEALGEINIEVPARAPEK